MALARSLGIKPLKPVSFGHREFLGKKIEAKEANRVPAACYLLAVAVLGALRCGGLDRAHTRPGAFQPPAQPGHQTLLEFPRNY
jgi:hypothetical protein